VLPRALWRPALFFFAVAQIFLSFAPLLEARQGPDARAHVEEAGTTLHHAHNEADCAACAARSLMASAEAAGNGEIPVHISSSSIISTATHVVGAAWTSHSRSRAPPVLTA
jgi:acyl-CoA reductase-like NAD-dependent aldehyde dehydrogenase